MLNDIKELKVVLTQVNCDNITNIFEQKLLIKHIYKKYYLLSAEKFSDLCTLTNNIKCRDELVENNKTTLTLKYSNKNVYLTFEFDVE